MARRKTAKRSKRKRRSTGPLPVKAIIVFLSCAILLAGAGYGVWYFFLNSRFFAIREITVNKDQDYSFRQGERKLERVSNLF